MVLILFSIFLVFFSGREYKKAASELRQLFQLQQSIYFNLSDICWLRSSRILVILTHRITLEPFYFVYYSNWFNFNSIRWGIEWSTNSSSLWKWDLKLKCIGCCFLQFIFYMRSIKMTFCICNYTWKEKRFVIFFLIIQISDSDQQWKFENYSKSLPKQQEQFWFTQISLLHKKNVSYISQFIFVKNIRCDSNEIAI